MESHSYGISSYNTRDVQEQEPTSTSLQLHGMECNRAWPWSACQENIGIKPSLEGGNLPKLSHGSGSSTSAPALPAEEVAEKPC